MPRFDKTGPRGAGPKTGRGLGYCEEEVEDLDETKSLAEKIIKKIL